MSPRKIGKYLVLERIDTGRMCEVFHAASPSGQSVAIKIALPEVVSDPVLLLHFQDEIRTTLSLVHRHIVRGITDGVHEGRPYLVLEFIDGGTLRHADNREKFQEPRRILELMRQVTAAICAAHAQGVIHCDLSPSNILLDEARLPYVADFGLARNPWRPEHLNRLRGGTHGYTAPFDETRENRATIDVFSLGAIFSELADEAVIAPGDWLERRRSARLLAEIKLCCRKAKAEPGSRPYETAAALLQDLQRLLDGGTILPLGPFARMLHWSETHPRQALMVWTLLTLAAYGGSELVGMMHADASFHRGMLHQGNCRATRRLALHAEQVLASERRIVDEAGRALGLIDFEQGYMCGPPAELECAPPALVTCDVTQPGACKTPAPIQDAAAQGHFTSMFFVYLGGAPGPYWLQPLQFQWVNVAWRDYYTGALQPGADGAYVSKAYRYTSADHGSLRFALSVPVRAADENVIGVLVATIEAGRVFAQLSNDVSQDGHLVSAILAPQDRPRPKAELPKHLVVVTHASFENGARAQHWELIEPQLSVRERDCTSAQPSDHELDDFRSADPHQRLFAEVVPVGNTGLFALEGMLVSEADEHAFALRAPTLRSLGLLGGGLVLAAFSVLRSTRRRASKRD